MAQPDVTAIQRFEAALLHEFENRKCLLVRYTEDGFVVAGGEPPYSQFRILSRELYDMQQKGKQLGEIAEFILKSSPSSQEAAPAAGPAIKGKNDRLIAVVRDGRFMLDTIEAIKKQKGISSIAPNEPALPVAYQWAPQHSYYILCGIDTGSGYSFVTQEKFGEYGVDDGQMRTLLFENLYTKLVAMIKEGQVRLVKVADGVFAMRVGGGLAPSFLVISNVFFDYIRQATGLSDAEFIFAYPISTEDILLVNPKAVVESMNAAMEYMKVSQEEARKSGAMVLLEPLIITKTRITFLLDEMAKAKPPPQDKPANPPQQ
jgi:hypothetical protein